MEPGAPPPAAPAEPALAPPAGGTFEGESEFVFRKDAFTVNVFGQQLKTETAAKIIGALVVALVVLVVFATSGGSEPKPPPVVPGTSLSATGGTPTYSHGGRCRERTPGGEWTCAQQREWGKCDVAANPWMRGYCCETCTGCAEECTSVYNFHVFDETAPPSLLLSYDFNEGGGSAVLDGSGLHNDMDLADERHVGEVSWVSAGVCGSALEFFTEDEGACVQTPAFEVNRGITTSLWVWLHSTGNDALWEEQILNCAGGGGSLVLASSAQDDAWRARMWNSEDANYILPSTGRQVQTNRWVHLATTFDDTLSATESLVLYVDGIPFRNSEETARLLPNLMKGGSARCTLGCHYWSARNPQYNAQGELIPGKYFDGLVDEMRVWDDYLSHAQIMDEQRHDHCTPLLAFWGFNGRSGDVVVNSGPRGNLDIDITGGEQFHEVAWAQKGVCGSALEFMADESSPSCVQTAQIPFDEKVTISIWVRLHTVGRSLEMYGGIHGAEQVINCHGGTPGQSVILEATDTDETEGPPFWRARIYTPAYKSLRVDGSPIAIGQWQHLVLVYDDTHTADPTQQAVLYVDGERFTGDAKGYDGAGRPGTAGNQMVWPNRLHNADPPATCNIGCHGSGRSFFDGLIDEVRIFSGALEPHAVLQDYAHAWCSESMTGAYILDGLLAFYDFNEGEGDVVSDSAVETGRFAGRHRPSLNLRTLGAMGEVSWERPGLCGAALEFYSVGQQPATLNTPAIAFGEAVTISVWAFVHTSGSTQDAHGGPLGSEQIINCNSNYLLDGTTGFTLALESIPERNAWRARINSQQYAEQLRNQGTYALSEEGSLHVNTWTHLAVVLDPSEAPASILKLYVDGVLYTGQDGHGELAGVSNKCSQVHGAAAGREGEEWCTPRSWENQLQGSSSSGTSSCAIGGHPSMGAYFDGLIDEVRIFDHALTAGDVAQEATHYWCENMAESTPLLKYNFDEGGGLDIHDESPYHNDLDIAAAEHLGDAAWVSNGVCNSALEFDTEHPDRSGDCLQTAPIPIGRSVTFSMWVYLHDMVPQALQTLHCKNVNRANGLSENFVFGTTADQTRWFTRIYSAEISRECAPANSGENCACGAVDDTSSCGSDNVYGPADGPNAVQRNQWVHLAATYDESGGRDADDPRSQLILYINGDPYYNDRFNRFLPNRLFGGVTCEIGCRIRGDGVTALDFFDGLLDEVQVLERALTAQEIRTQLYELPDCVPLILHLSFNEGSGRTLHDSSPQALHVELDPSSPLANDGAALAGQPGWVKGNAAVCGSALELMTDGEGDCFTLDAVPFGSAVTISLWARLRSDDQGGNGGGAGQIINCHSDGANSGGHTEALVIETRAPDGSHSGQWQGRTWIQSQGNNAVSADYEMDVWTHLTLVYDDSQDALRQLVLYVNGMPHFGNAQQIWENMLTLGGGYCSVGCHPAAGADGLPGQAFFDGFIDELRIFNGALSIAAIRNDFQHLWCSHSPPPPPPGSGLLLFYPFDEAEGRWVGDYSAHDPPMSIDMEAGMTWSPTDPSEVHWITPGVCGSALEFFTNRSGDCLETPVVDVGEALSISVWVFLHSVGETLAAHGGPQGSEQVINCHGGMSLVLEAFPGDNVWRVRTYNSNQGDHYVPGATIVPNRWTHLAVVYDPVCDSTAGADMVCTGPGGDPTAATILYVDGVAYRGDSLSRQHGPDGDGTMREPMVWKNHLRDSDSVTCTIGCHPGRGGQAFFDGLIDEVRIFDRALSSLEVLETEAQHSWCTRADRGNNYHYTSFEEPAAPDCSCPPDPALLGTAVTGCEVSNQGACLNSFPTLLEGRPCLSDSSGSPDVCEITREMSVITGGWANRQPAGTVGHYSTNYVAGTNGNAELGFRTFYQSCAAGAGILSHVTCTDESVANINGNNLGVISMYNVGPTNGNAIPPNYNGWGACDEGGTFGAGSHRLPHGEQCYMMDNTRGFAWVELDQVSLTAISNPVASVWVHLESSGYEETDAIRVWVTTRYCGDVEILSGVLDDEAHPTSLDENGEEVRIEEDQWQRHQVSLPGCGTAAVKFGVQANNGNEEVWFDMVEIRDV